MGAQKFALFLEEFDPLRHFSWLAEGGGQSRKRLTSALFLAFRQLHAAALRSKNQEPNSKNQFAKTTFGSWFLQIGSSRGSASINHPSRDVAVGVDAAGSSR